MLLIYNMHYLESQKIKNEPKLYQGIEGSVSWILKENFIYDFFEPLSRDIKILDIGCGNGFFLDKLAEFGFCNLYGADIANYLNNKNHRHAVVDINRENLSYQDETFDVVTAFQVLEHLENYFLILQEAKRVLKPGGYFIFSTPNQFNFFYRVKFLLTGNVTGWDLKNNHLLFLTRDVFQKTTLKDFSLVKKYYNRGPVPMLGRLNFIPGIRFKAKTRLLPRGEFFSDKVCYILKKK